MLVHDDGDLIIIVKMSLDRRRAGSITHTSMACLLSPQSLSLCAISVWTI